MSSPLKSASKGRFQIYDPIGAGAVATVYRAYDRKRNEMCALKLMNEESSSSAKRRRRFLSEAQAMELLEHPNIVPVRAVGEDKGRLWIAMELMGGGSAGRALKKQGPLPADKALDIVYKVLLGLEQAHAAGLIHRDVKPQNILLGDDDAVKLCDFGIARKEKVDDSAVTPEGLTQMFDRLGSIIYMAPEQRVDPRDVDRGTDIYAMGATLYALLTGRRPPDLSRAPIRPKMLDSVPAPLRPLLLKSTHLDRTERYATAEEMSNEVLRLRDDARLRPEWYQRPTKTTRQKSIEEDFAQWPERHAVAASTPPPPKGRDGSPEMPLTLSPDSVPPVQRPPSRAPSLVHRRASYRPGSLPSRRPTVSPPAALPASKQKQLREAVRRDSLPPRPGRRVPRAVWVVLAVFVAFVLFAVGLGGGILLMRAF